MALRQAPRLLALAAQQGGAAAAAAAAAAEAGAASSPGLQQACGRQHRLFQQLVSGMRADASRLYSQQQQPAFQPSRLYPRQRTTSEACAFWGLVGLNVGFAFVAKSDSPEVRQAIGRHFTTSVEALADGRYYTLLTSSVCHTSLVHAGLNLLLLLLYRHTQPLTAREVRRCGGTRRMQAIADDAAAAAAAGCALQPARTACLTPPPSSLSLSDCCCLHGLLPVAPDCCCSCCCCTCWAALSAASRTSHTAGGTQQVRV